MSERDVDQYFAGESLYGDDLDQTQVAAWYADEAKSYANLGARDATRYQYEYHAWNTLLGYNHLPAASFARVLGFGSAYGEELVPIIRRISSITIVDPSGAFVRESVHGVPTTYVKPATNGALPFPEGAFDLITCFGVLHHIPNVSAVLRELSRVLKCGCCMLLREPIVSMGDWRQPRRGLTKHERGIPLHLLENMLRECGFATLRRSLCGFPLTERLFRVTREDIYNSPVAAWVDQKVSAAFAWNVNYHPRNLLQHFRPTSVFLVLRKPGTDPAP